MQARACAAAHSTARVAERASRRTPRRTRVVFVLDAAGHEPDREQRARDDRVVARVEVLVNERQPALHVPERDEPERRGRRRLAVVLVLEDPVHCARAQQGSRGGGRRGGRRRSGSDGVRWMRGQEWMDVGVAAGMRSGAHAAAQCACEAATEGARPRGGAAGACKAARMRRQDTRSDARRPPHTARSRAQLQRRRAPESPLASLEGVTSLSWPKPALTNPLTKVDARFWRALSSAAPCGWRPSACVHGVGQRIAAGVSSM